MKKRTKISLVGVVALFGVLVWQCFKEDYGVGVDSVSWFPAEAQNVTYIKNDLLRIAEFDV